MNLIDLKKRPFEFPSRIVRLCAALPRDRICGVVAKQLLRAGTSVGANYRAACKARSAAEFAAKIGIVEEEADGCGYWIELLIEVGVVKPTKVESLHAEAMEWVSVAAASRKTVRVRTNRQSTIDSRKSG